MRSHFTGAQEGFRTPALLFGAAVVGFQLGELTYFLETTTWYNTIASVSFAPWYDFVTGGLFIWLALARQDPWHRAAWTVQGVRRLASYFTPLGGPGIAAWSARSGLDVIFGACLVVGSHRLTRSLSARKWWVVASVVFVAAVLFRYSTLRYLEDSVLDRVR